MPALTALRTQESQEEPAITTMPPGTATALSYSEGTAAEYIDVFIDEDIERMNMQNYLEGVVAAEMPASFPLEALKAQAVAARTYAIYCADGNKHGDAQVCTDYACCQAWLDDVSLRERWGDGYETYVERIRTAVEQTEGQYLSYEGQAVFAAFHSSSAGTTADCGQVWNPRPYLISVSSPETEADVPDYITQVVCTAIDFRDTVLYAFPEADFTGEENTWINSIDRDSSGRVVHGRLSGPHPSRYRHP